MNDLKEIDFYVQWPDNAATTDEFVLEKKNELNLDAKEMWYDAQKTLTFKFLIYVLCKVNWK